MMPIKKVLITGAGGFLGRYIARDLVQTGNYEVHSFSRKYHHHLAALNVIQHGGDLKNYFDVENALKEMDAVIHCASKVGMWGDYQDFYETNVLGTENIILACKKLNIKRCVYTSTPSVIFGNKALCGVDENISYPSSHLNYYAKTKALAEKSILLANSNTFSTVAIRPHLVFGPGDLNLIPQIIKGAQEKKLKIIGDARNLVDVTYVENASYAHLMALEKLTPGSSIAGKAYFLGQGPVNLWDFINEILIRSKAPTVSKKIPLWSAYILGFFAELFLKKPPITRFIALQLGLSHYYGHQNIEKDLGFKPKFSIEEGLDKLFEHS